MPSLLNLKLDISDTTTLDTLRGPGSSSTEQIPSTSPILTSPLPSSTDSYRHQELVAADLVFDSRKGENVFSSFSESNQEEWGLHFIVVGGDVGAFASALALAKTEQFRVTLVNVGIGPLSVIGSGDAVRGTLLNGRTLAYLDDLGKWQGPNCYGSRRDTPFELESKSYRWKGKGPINDSVSIGERIRDEGFCLKTFQFQRYLDGGELVFQEYSVSSGEDVSMFAIDTEMLVTILRDSCLAHPRIKVRPRGIVRAVLPGAAAPPTQVNDFNAGLSSNGVFAGARSGCVGTVEHSEPSKRDPEHRHRVRESFIQLDDDEHDASQFLFIPPVPLAPLPDPDASLTELLRNLPSQLQEQRSDLFSAEDLASEPASSITSLVDGLDESVKGYKPAIVLTSGEQLEADAVLGTEGPESKVLDAIRLDENDTQRVDVVREDGIFRATIPTGRLMQDQELRTLTSRLVTWLGPGRFLTTYPIYLKNSNSLHIFLAVEGGRIREGVVNEDDDSAIVHQMTNEVIGWCPIVKKLVALIDSATYEPVFDYNPLEQWVSTSGRVAVLGNAAHPLLPFAHQALSATISDALTLGSLFSKPLLHKSNVHPHLDLRSPHLTPHLLNAFATLRRPHCLRTQLTVREGRDLFLLPDGENQTRRDKMFKESGLLSEEEKRAEWLFDPLEEVESWWAEEVRSMSLQQ